MGQRTADHGMPHRAVVIPTMMPLKNFLSASAIALPTRQKLNSAHSSNWPTMESSWPLYGTSPTASIHSSDRSLRVWLKRRHRPSKSSTGKRHGTSMPIIFGSKQWTKILPSSDFFTIDVADAIGKAADAGLVRSFCDRHPESMDTLRIRELLLP